MKVFRFMGADEAMRLCAGHTLHQCNDWHKLGYDSTSKGFTFGIGTSHDAVEASRWLKGVVQMQYLLEADIDKEILHPCVGRYPDYRLADPMSKKREIKEFYANEYSLDNCHSFTFYACLGILPNTQIVTLQMMLNEQFVGLMVGNLMSFYQKASSFGHLANMEIMDERDLTEIEIINKRLKFIREKKKESDDKTREAFTK